MSKRGAPFKRKANDYYPTPMKAVLPLLPYLDGIKTFVEPCAGKGVLVGHLKAHGFKCAYASDITAGYDALKFKHWGGVVITNPPHTRKIMHPLIEHFIKTSPVSWLLIDLDWAATKQARHLMTKCSDIVVVGRVKWFPKSKATSLDNFGWYKFSARHRGPTAFHPLKV